VSRLGALDVLILAAWCGLAGGEFEVAARVVTRALSSTNQLYLLTRHFVWLIPAIDLVLFIGVGIGFALAMRRWPRRMGWWGPRLIITWAVLPGLSVAVPGIYLEAWLLVALGVAACLAPVVERHPAGARRWMVRSAPVLLVLVLLQGGWILGSDRIKQWHEAGRPLPPAGSPNVLLIVLDTVGADHLSVYGYQRPTTPNLERLARRGIRFDRARAAAPWTLASHANMFTGRWPHELALRWTCPLEGDVPMLAEYLESLGYATAGFVGNTFYVSYDSGIDRGFTHYEDYVLDGLNAARTVKLINEVLLVTSQLGRFWPMSCQTSLALSSGARKDARIINRALLDWLSQRREPQRPFFAFVNYVDAHSPYLLPPGVPDRLGSPRMSDADMRLLAESWTDANRQRFPQAARRLVRDAYDGCLAYLDDRLGELIDDLERRGVLDETLVIITADHGEGLGEHDLFDHGESLYRTEIRVPLLIVLPAVSGRPVSPEVVDSRVSLRDIAATIAGFVRPAAKSPFPGRSVLPVDVSSATAARARSDDHDTLVLSELATPNPSDPNQHRSPAYRGPLISMAEGDYVYIRNEGDGREELFHERDDPHELSNLARVEAMGPVLRRFRDLVSRAKVPAPATRDAGAAPGVASTPNFR
jgi:arylsulfatase A-like enzyme